MRKNVRFLKRFAAVSAALCMLMFSVLPVSALRKYEDIMSNCQLFDPDGLFTPEDRELLNDLIRDTSREIDMYVAVQVVGEATEILSDDEVDELTADRYDELFNVQYGEESDGVMLMLYMPSQYMSITTCGNGQLYYAHSPEDRISNMISHIGDQMREEKYTGAVTIFCADLKLYYSKGIPNRTYTYDPNQGLYYWQKDGELVSGTKLPFSIRVNLKLLLPCCALVGIIAAFITMLIVQSGYQLKKSLDPSNYISKKDTNFYQQDDVFIRAHTTKTYIDSDRGGSGGGGGNISSLSSGGFSHGGGGGHW